MANNITYYVYDEQSGTVSYIRPSMLDSYSQINDGTTLVEWYCQREVGRSFGAYLFGKDEKGETVTFQVKGSELLEALRLGTRSNYISDLKRSTLTKPMRKRIKAFMEHYIPASSFSYSEWVNTYDYMTGKKMNADNAIDAKVEFLNSLN